MTVQYGSVMFFSLDKAQYMNSYQVSNEDSGENIYKSVKERSMVYFANLSGQNIHDYV